MRRSFAGVSTSVARRALVSVILRQFDMPIRLPFYEFVGTGPDVVLDINRFAARVGRNSLRVDRRSSVDECHQVLPRAERAAERQCNAVRARSRHIGNIGKQQLSPGPMGAPAVKGRDNIRGSHGLTIVKTDVTAQVDCDRLSILTNLFSRSEQRLRLVVSIESVETFKYVMGNCGGKVGSDHLLVQTWRLTNSRITKRLSCQSWH